MAKVVQLLQKMGLVEVARPPGSRPAATPPPASDGAATPDTVKAPAPDPVTRLSPPGPPPKFEGTAADAAAGDESEEFAVDDVYASAAIEEPTHGFTVFKLIELMGSEELRELDPATAAKVITGMLRRLPSGAVDVDDIIRDAVLRDQALDAFESFLGERVDATSREVRDSNLVLQQEIDELTRKNTALMEANQARVEREKARLDRWRRRKRTEEERLFQAVQPFVESNPVTREADPD